ncbi:MAG: hypothetical protein ACRD2Z_11980 [Thermoanaerobaculia bacterium]
MYRSRRSVEVRRLPGMRRFGEHQVFGCGVDRIPVGPMMRLAELQGQRRQNRQREEPSPPPSREPTRRYHV